MPFTQENRLIAVDTPLGKNALLLTGFRGREGLSIPFSFELSMLSENHNIVFKDIIGKSATISIVLTDGSNRYINGIVSRFSQGRGGAEAGGDPTFSYYTATMAPWIWLLTRTSDSRIFQSLSVPDIVEKIFGEKGFTDYALRLHGSYEKRNYCVQYRETDFNFVSRLLEEEGIYYFFEHEHGKHTLVLADVPDEHKPCPKQDTARYQLSAGGWVEADVITGFDRTQEIHPAKYTLNDYNFEIPRTDLKVEVSSNQPMGPGEREIYDYPGSYTKRTAGDRYANIRMQEEEAKITTLAGSSVCRAFTSGYRFVLKHHYRNDMNDKAYVLTSIDHDVTHGGGFMGASFESNASELSYENAFTCIPFDVPYRPPRMAVIPTIKGTQTAFVVGPAGEEIYTDEYGRIKVQFHWDREGKRDDKSSCWIRVGQIWASGSWGGLFIPRIGQEVIVDFLEGNPDKPIVIGCVYHGTNKPPYSLPGEKTKSTIKSDSSLGGGGFNEFRFEDKKGNEEIYLHGQKDWTILIEHDKNQKVLNNETLFVGVNRDKTVGASQTEAIGVNKTITVGANHTETITGNMAQTVVMAKAETIALAKALTIGGAYQVSVGAVMNETIGAAKAEEIGASKTVAVGANSSEEIGSNKSVNVGKNISENAGKDVSVQAGKNITETAGKDVIIQAGKNMTLTAGDQVVIKCGSASITMKKNGDIMIKGKTINIKGSGNVVIKGQKILEN